LEKKEAVAVIHHTMAIKGDSPCDHCSSPESNLLDDNCPVCLMRLGELYSPDERAAKSQPLRILGDYELLSEIARGGMGVVYLARQVNLNRQVALKVLPGGQFANETFIKRFRREAEALASLNHPNVVSIHEVVEGEGQIYFSMDLIKGYSLAETIHDKPLPARQAAALIQQVAAAVAFVHERGLLHRDLKPSNILLDNEGVPHITDFGLAKRSNDDGDLTLTGEILGSPNYMAPEQADPKLASATPASDVYSLGAILYHLLTGRPPFVADTVAQTLRLLADGGPVPPRLLRPGVARDLETICLKCLETDPKRRYQSAQELWEELDRFHKSRPIRARPIGALARLWRWSRRKPSLASALGVVGVSLLVLAIGSLIAFMKIQRERDLSDAARKQEAVFRIRAEKAQQQERCQLYRALLEQAHASVRSGELGQRLQALDAIKRAAAITNSVDLRREAVAALALPDLRFERELPAGPEFTLELMDPLFESAALCRGSGPVEIRGTSDWQLKATLPCTTKLPAYAGWWSRDGRYFAVKRDLTQFGERGVLEVWDISIQQRVNAPREMVSQAMSFHPLVHRIILGQPGGVVTTWDLEEGRRVARLQLASTPVRLEFSPDGQRFAAVEESSGRATVSVYDSNTGVVRSSHAFADSVLDLKWHPSGRWLAVAEYSGMVQLMDSQTGKTRGFGSHKTQAATVVFSPDGDYLFSGGWECELICWNTRTMQRALTIGRQSWIAQFRSDGLECALLTPSAIELHAFARPNQREFFEDLGPRLQHARFSADGRWLAASADQHLGVWELAGTGFGAVTEEEEDARPAFAADGRELFAMGSGAGCGRWRIIPATNALGNPMLEPVALPPQDKLGSLSFVSNLIAFTGPSGSRISRLDDAGAAPHWVRTPQGINGLSPDARWLGVYQSFSPLLDVYRLPAMDHVATLQNQANIIEFTFVPGGDQLAVSSRSGVEFWDTNSWRRTRVLTNFTGILFAPEAPAWWLTTDFRSAGLYDAITLEPLLPLPMGTLPLAISDDGRLLAVSVDFRRLQVWNMRDLRNQLNELGLDWLVSSGRVADRKQ
jgi:WD40 repeat protein